MANDPYMVEPRRRIRVKYPYINHVGYVTLTEWLGFFFLRKNSVSSL